MTSSPDQFGERRKKFFTFDQHEVSTKIKVIKFQCPEKNGLEEKNSCKQLEMFLFHSSNFNVMTFHLYILFVWPTECWKLTFFFNRSNC